MCLVSSAIRYSEALSDMSCLFVFSIFAKSASTFWLKSLARSKPVILFHLVVYSDDFSSRFLFASAFFASLAFFANSMPFLIMSASDMAASEGMRSGAAAALCPVGDWLSTSMIPGGSAGARLACCGVCGRPTGLVCCCSCTAPTVLVCSDCGGPACCWFCTNPTVLVCKDCSGPAVGCCWCCTNPAGLKCGDCGGPVGLNAPRFATSAGQTALSCGSKPGWFGKVGMPNEFASIAAPPCPSASILPCCSTLADNFLSVSLRSYSWS